jgi:hypothetical protein
MMIHFTLYYTHYFSIHLIDVHVRSALKRGDRDTLFIIFNIINCTIYFFYFYISSLPEYYIISINFIIIKLSSKKILNYSLLDDYHLKYYLNRHPSRKTQKGEYNLKNTKNVS